MEKLSLSEKKVQVENMRIHWFQHVPFEGLGSIEHWIKSRGYSLRHTPFFHSSTLPALEDFDFLIIMGGPMSVRGEDQFPWLIPEKQLIRRAIEAGKRVLGVCLGAQLIASALGARVFPCPQKEIGWFPIRGVASPDETLFRFPEQEVVFHWHGETFELPAGAQRLAESEGCANQAFQIGKTVVGLQFHLETTPEAAQELVTHGRHELVPAPFVQSAEEILAAPPQRYRRINRLMEQVLEFLSQ